MVKQVLISRANGTKTKLNSSFQVRFCTICYHLYNLKKVWNSHGGVFKHAALIKVALLCGCFLLFLNCTNGTKSGNASQMFYKCSIKPTMYIWKNAAGEYHTSKIAYFWIDVFFIIFFPSSCFLLQVHLERYSVSKIKTELNSVIASDCRPSVDCRP